MRKILNVTRRRPSTGSNSSRGSTGAGSGHNNRRISVASLNSSAIQIVRGGYNIDLNKVDSAFTKLHKACLQNDENKVKKILRSGKIKPNATDNSKRCPIHLATVNNNLHIIRMLMEHGANLNVMDSEGKTPLMKAVECNHEDLVQFFIYGGADVSFEDKENGNSALHLSIINGSEKAAEVLLKTESVDVNKRNKKMETPLHLAVKNGSISIQLIEDIVKRGATLDAKDNEGRTPLMIATDMSGNRAVVELLIKYGAHAYNNDEVIGDRRLSRSSSAGTKNSDHHRPEVVHRHHELDSDHSWPDTDNEDAVDHAAKKKVPTSVPVALLKNILEGKRESPSSHSKAAQSPHPDPLSGAVVKLAEETIVEEFSLAQDSTKDHGGLAHPSTSQGSKSAGHERNSSRNSSLHLVSRSSSSSNGEDSTRPFLRSHGSNHLRSSKRSYVEPHELESNSVVLRRGSGGDRKLERQLAQSYANKNRNESTDLDDLLKASDPNETLNDLSNDDFISQIKELLDEPPPSLAKPLRSISEPYPERRETENNLSPKTVPSSSSHEIRGKGSSHHSAKNIPLSHKKTSQPSVTTSNVTHSGQKGSPTNQSPPLNEEILEVVQISQTQANQSQTSTPKSGSAKISPTKYQRTINELKIEQQKLINEKVHLERELESMKVRCSQLETALDNSKTEHLDAEKRLVKIEADVNQAKFEANYVKRENDELKMQIKVLLEEKESFNSRFEQLRLENVLLTKEKEKLELDLVSAKTCSSRKSETGHSDQVSSTDRELLAELEILKSKCERLSEDKARLKSEYLQVKDELSRTKSTNTMAVSNANETTPISSDQTFQLLQKLMEQENEIHGLRLQLLEIKQHQGPSIAPSMQNGKLEATTPPKDGSSTSRGVETDSKTQTDQDPDEQNVKLVNSIAELNSIVNKLGEKLNASISDAKKQPGDEKDSLIKALLIENEQQRRSHTEEVFQNTRQVLDQVRSELNEFRGLVEETKSSSTHSDRATGPNEKSARDMENSEKTLPADLFERRMNELKTCVERLEDNLQQHELQLLMRQSEMCFYSSNPQTFVSSTNSLPSVGLGLGLGSNNLSAHSKETALYLAATSAASSQADSLRPKSLFVQNLMQSIAAQQQSLYHHNPLFGLSSLSSGPTPSDELRKISSNPPPALSLTNMNAFNEINSNISSFYFTKNNLQKQIASLKNELGLINKKLSVDKPNTEANSYVPPSQ